MIKVLVIDDSFVMRKLLSDILNSDSKVTVVGAVKNGREALKIIPRLRPDVITLDLVMPGWDGLTTLRHIMDEYPTPVVILSAHSREGADITMECLGAGAVGFILKPSGELSLDIEEVSAKLLEAVKTASTVKVAKISKLFVRAAGRPVEYKAGGTGKVVVIGASTGGPQTLAAVLSSLPANFLPPVIVVQHMPGREFTESLVKHLGRVCKLTVRVVEDNEAVERGTIYLVPGGYSMRVEAKDQRREAGGHRPGVVMRLVKDKPDALTPSIDMTMRSIAGVFKDNAVGVVLTGMGSDGARGMEAIKAAGGTTVVQDKSSLIFGMPEAVIDRGCADSVLPAGEIAGKIAGLVANIDG